MSIFHQAKNQCQNKNKKATYDKILKENIEEVILPLVGKYLGLDIIKTEKLEAKLQTTIEKETDLLRIITTKDGKRRILHLEFQSENEKDMIYRVKEYDGIVQRKYKLPILHFVVFLGSGRMTMRAQLYEDEVFSEFKVLNISELSFDEMIQSQIPEEIVLAILSDFRGEHPEQIIRSIILKLIESSKSKADLRKFIQQLHILSKLRKLDTETTKVSNNMLITIDLRDHALYKLGAEESLEKKTRLDIISMLNDDIPIDKIAQYLRVSIDDIIQVKNELHEKETAELKRVAIINMLERNISIEDIAESQKVSIDEVISIKNELDQQQE